MLVEQMLDRLEAARMIVGWNRTEWEITTANCRSGYHDQTGQEDQGEEERIGRGIECLAKPLTERIHRPQKML